MTIVLTIIVYELINNKNYLIFFYHKIIFSNELLYCDEVLRTTLVGAKICLRRRGWSRGSRSRRWDLQKKSKQELGLLQQDPPMLKSVLCLNKNGVLERKF